MKCNWCLLRCCVFVGVWVGVWGVGGCVSLCEWPAMCSGMVVVTIHLPCLNGSWFVMVLVCVCEIVV